MRENVGVLDTAIRSIIACVALAFAFENTFGTTVSVVFIIIGTLAFITSCTGICLLYKIFNINTMGSPSEEASDTQKC